MLGSLLILFDAENSYRSVDWIKWVFRDLQLRNEQECIVRATNEWWGENEGDLLRF